MNQKEYLYIIVRADLSPAQRAVQSVHASIEAIKNKALHSHPSVIILAVKNELKLNLLKMLLMNLKKILSRNMIFL